MPACLAISRVGASVPCFAMTCVAADKIERRFSSLLARAIVLFLMSVHSLLHAMRICARQVLSKPSADPVSPCLSWKSGSVCHSDTASAVILDFSLQACLHVNFQATSMPV